MAVKVLSRTDGRRKIKVVLCPATRDLCGGLIIHLYETYCTDVPGRGQHCSLGCARFTFR